MKRKRFALIFFGLVLLLASSMGVSVYRSARQSALNRALLAAVKHQDAPAVTRLLDAGADANTRDVPADRRNLLRRLYDSLLHRPLPIPQSKPTPLLLAVGTTTDASFARHPWPNEPESMVRLLLVHHADPNARDSNHDTPLICACREGYSRCARLLVEHGANPNGAGYCHNVPLMYTYGDMNLTAYLLQHGADARRINDNGQGVLHQMADDASTPGAASLIRLLVQHGADLNAQDCNGETPLHHARQFWRKDIVHALEALHADGSRHPQQLSRVFNAPDKW